MFILQELGEFEGEQDDSIAGSSQCKVDLGQGFSGSIRFWGFTI